MSDIKKKAMLDNSRYRQSMQEVFYVTQQDYIKTTLSYKVKEFIKNLFKRG